LASCTFAAAVFIVSLPYSTTASTASFNISLPFSKELFTPVKTSRLSLPALFTSSNAPAKSPLNTFLTAEAK
jgi:hypothetical protein